MPTSRNILEWRYHDRITEVNYGVRTMLAKSRSCNSIHCKMNCRIPGHGLSSHSPEKTWDSTHSREVEKAIRSSTCGRSWGKSPKYYKQYNPDQSLHKHWIEEWENHIHSATENWTIPKSQIQFFALSWRTLIQCIVQKCAKRNAAYKGCLQKCPWHVHVP